MRVRHRTVDIRLVLVVASAVAATLVLVVLALRPASPPQAADRAAAPEERVGPEREDGSDRYVALGDWWAAGPGAAGAQAGAEDRACRRSTVSYPALVAARLGVDLVHRACAGASPEVVGLGGRAGDGREVLPQVLSLSEGTDLVTLSVGAESADLLADTVSACLRVATRAPSGSPCEDEFGSAGLDAVTSASLTLEQRIERLLGEVARRAPRARVLVVGYADFFATDTGCFDRAGVAEGDLAYLSTALGLIVDAVRGAASRSGATYVDPTGVFAGHLVCSREPYVVRDPTRGGPGFSLTRSGHEALASAVVRVLAEQQRQ